MMAASHENTGLLVEVLPATKAQEPVLANLLELYAHDFSEFIPLELKRDGRFGYDALPLYWTEPGRHPFLLRVNGKLAGFAFVRQGSQVSGDPQVWDVAEFFIVRRYRRLGVGVTVAHELWRRFPGKWEVRVRAQNRPALAFWGRAVAGFIGTEVRPDSFELEGVDWHLFSFESNHYLPAR